jgi:DNA-binding HxlR family transcriptional regulator
VPPRLEYVLNDKGNLLVQVIDEMPHVGKPFIEPK